MKYLGIDFGEKRIGIALSDPEETMAFPKDVFENNAQVVPKIVNLIKSEGVEGVVMGESRNFQGEKNAIYSASESFAEALKSETGLEVLLEPELYTSAEAERLQGKNSKLDASAAAIILTSYLNKKRNMGN
jgi:putative holliday junction resolvase